MRQIWWLVPACAFALLSGCGGPEAKTSPNAPPAFKELKTTILEPGKGSISVAKGDTVYAEYVGTLVDGTQFDGNKDGGNPLSFVVGNKAVIEGWDEGFIGMKVGEKRKLEIPSAKGYGPSGSGEKIPPNADLIFEVKVLALIKAGEEGTYDAEDTKVGSGPVVKTGDKVEIHYKGTYLNGKEFDDSRKRGKTLTFTVGSVKAPRVIPGLDDGVIGMKPGGKRSLKLPPDLVFGPRGTPTLQGNQFVNLDVELISVNGRKG